MAGGKGIQNIENTAKEVLNQIKNKQLVNVKGAMLKVGYRQTTAKAKCSSITKHPVYIRTMENFQASLEDKRAQVMAFTTEKDIKKASLRDKVNALDVYSKNINLITGKPTEITHNISGILDLLEARNQATNNKANNGQA